MVLSVLWSCFCLRGIDYWSSIWWDFRIIWDFTGNFLDLWESWLFAHWINMRRIKVFFFFLKFRLVTVDCAFTWTFTRNLKFFLFTIFFILILALLRLNILHRFIRVKWVSSFRFLIRLAISAIFLLISPYIKRRWLRRRTWAIRRFRRSLIAWLCWSLIKLLSNWPYALLIYDMRQLPCVSVVLTSTWHDRGPSWSFSSWV